METPTFCDMILLKGFAEFGNPYRECYKLGNVKYIHKADVIKYFNITETRYKLLVRDGYLRASKDFVTLESFLQLMKLCKLYTSNENNLRVTHFPPLAWLKNKYTGLK